MTIKSSLQHTEFKYWFIGFTEGGGSFIVNKNGSLEFKITQPSVDAQVLFFIKKELGFGSVSIQDKKNKTHHFRVRNKEGFFELITIFNGNFYTEKKAEQFKKWVKAFNEAYKENIKVLSSFNELTTKNAWLAGFTDVEGYFTISMLKRSKFYTQVQVRYILSQGKEEKFMAQISKLLNGKVYYLKSYGGYNMVVNLTKLSSTINYFSFYGLKTKKYISYLNWLKVYKLVINKEHFNQFGLEKIRAIMAKINKE